MKTLIQIAKEVLQRRKAFNRRTRSEAWPAYMLTHENVLSMVVNRTRRRYRKFISNLRIEQRFRHRANGWRH